MPPTCAIAVLVLLMPALAIGAGFQGRVIGVTDGDTIVVRQSGQLLKIRLYGIDCPEMDQPYGEEARALTVAMAYDQIVTVEEVDRDRYGRIVAVITLPDGLNLSYELVRTGAAWWYERYAPNDLTLKAFQAEAQVSGLGLWAAPEAVPPWEWR